MPTPESFFLQCLFERLNNSGIDYAVMRNHEPLPYSAGGSDLDLLISPRDGGRAKAILYEAIHDAGGAALGNIETVGFLKVHALGRNTEPNGSWWGQCVDINFGLYYRGQCLLAGDVRWPTNDYRGILVLADGFAGILGVLKEVLHNGTIPKKYLAAAREGCVQCWPSIKQLLAPMGAVALERLQTLLLSEALADARIDECQKLRNAFFRHILFSRPSELLMGSVAYEWSKVRRYFSPSGKVIAILGVDGAGKSTVINAIKPVLDAATHNTTVVRHLRPTLLPPLARLKGKIALSNSPVLDPHGSKPSGTWGSLFRLVYLISNYAFGYWLRTRAQIAKQPTVVIFDRYAYDMALDPRRFRIALPSKLIWWFIRFVPKPDLIFCLYGTPEVLAARKQELPLNEVARQVMELKEFAIANPNAVLICTEGSIEETCDFVLLKLMDIYLSQSNSFIC